MARNEGTIPDTSTLSKSIKKKPYHHAAQTVGGRSLGSETRPIPFMEGHCWKVPQYRKARALFLFFTEQGRTKSGVRNEEGWLKGITALFQKVVNLHYHSWLIKTKIGASFQISSSEKSQALFWSPPSCRLIEESKSIEFIISEATRQDILHIKSYK